MEKAISDLKRHLLEIADLESVNRLLEWDECVYMPPGSATAHSRQKATLTRLAHEKFTSAAVGRLLDKLVLKTEDLPYDSEEASLIRVTKREYDRAVRVPSDFVTRLEEHKSDCYDGWWQAREENDFSAVLPHIRTAVELSREYAGFFPGYQHVADPLIQNHDYGLTVSSLKAVFRQIRYALLPLIEATAEEPEPEDGFLHQMYPKIKQLRFGQGVIERCGFDFTRGRQDLSLHPFSTNMSIDDVRITTNVNEYSFFDSFSSTMHEAGHAMYEQGISRGFEGLPLAKAPSLGMHESQARLWENLVGRSLPFWQYFFPALKAVFPEQLEDVTVNAFYRAINKVKPSLIRTEADEVTYNMHVMLRFDLEVALLEGTLEVEDLTDSWAERYSRDLKITPANHSEGVLQDVHWYCDLFGGGFQGYTIGNIISALCYECALEKEPGIVQEMKEGKFTLLLSWLNDNIYRHGASFTASELMQSLAGGPLPVAPYLRYLYSKYSRLYDLDIRLDDCHLGDERQSWTSEMIWSS
jgi:carboxypeptidase Taq